MNWIFKADPVFLISFLCLYIKHKNALIVINELFDRMTWIFLFNYQLTRLPSWNPDPMSSAAAKELETLSFLGPLFQLSIFSEDNVSFLYRFTVEDSCCVTRSALSIFCYRELYFAFYRTAVVFVMMPFYISAMSEHNHWVYNIILQ